MGKEDNTLMRVSAETRIEQIPRTKINIQKLFHKHFLLKYILDSLTKHICLSYFAFSSSHFSE